MTSLRRIEIENKKNIYNVRINETHQVVSVDGMFFTCYDTYPFEAPSIRVYGNYEDSHEFHFYSPKESSLLRNVSMTADWSPSMTIKDLIKMLKKYKC